jgi:hypothetical protein
LFVSVPVAPNPTWMPFCAVSVVGPAPVTVLFDTEIVVPVRLPTTPPFW